MEDSIKEDFFFSNPNDTIDSDGLEDNNGVDFAINTIFSNTNHKIDTKTNENLYHVSSDSVSKENATEVSSMPDMLSKKSRRKEKDIEEIRAKNRERTKKSREKRIKDILAMVNQINALKKENSMLKSKIKQLCPSCQLIIHSCDEENSTDDKTSEDSDTVRKKNVHIRHNSTITKKILPIFTIIAVICLIFTIMHFSSNGSRTILKSLNSKEKVQNRRRLLYDTIDNESKDEYEEICKKNNMYNYTKNDL